MILKAFADRPRDWSDVEGIVVRQGTLLEWRYVQVNLKPLAELKESPEILERLMKLKA